MAGPISEEEEFEFRFRAEQESAAPPPQTLGDRWKNAGPDPESRRQLAREIGRSFGELQYGDEAKAPRATAFGKTGRDMLFFGQGRRKIRKEAMKKFPDMTKEEASIVADEADRIQFDKRPVSTLAGGAVGLAGNIGATGGGVAALGRAPGAAGQVGRAVAMQKGQNIANAVRGAGGGAAGAEAVSLVGDERLATPFELALSTGLGGAAPLALGWAASRIGRSADPAGAAQDIVGRDIGSTGAEFADEFSSAAGQQLPVAAGALSPGSSSRIARSMPEPSEALDSIARAKGVMDDSLGPGMISRVRGAIPDSAPSDVLDDRVKIAATNFMSQEVQPGVSIGQIPVMLPPETLRSVVGIVEDLQTRGISVPLDLRQMQDLLRGRITLSEFDQARRNLNRAVSPGDNYDLSKRIRDTLNEAADVVDQTSAPGYKAAVVDDYAQGKLMAEGAQEGGKILSPSTPETFMARVRGTNAAQEADRLAGARSGIGENVLADLGQSPQSARQAAELVSQGDVASKLAQAVPGGGMDISRAGAAWSRADDAVRGLRSSPSPGGGEPVDSMMAVGTLSPYFITKKIAGVLRSIALPDSVRREVSELLTDPSRVDEAIEAMRRGGAKDNEIAKVLKNALPQAFGGVTERQAYDETGRKLTDDEAKDRLVINMASVVSRAIYDKRGKSGPDKGAELDSIQDRLEGLLDEGATPEQAIDVVMKERLR